MVAKSGQSINNRALNQGVRCDGQNPALETPMKYCFKLLGVILDCQWVFEEYTQELKGGRGDFRYYGFLFAFRRFSVSRFAFVVA